MHRFSREGVVPQQPLEVFEFVTDQSKLPLWSPEVVSSEVVGGGAVRAGSTLRQARRHGSRQMTNLVEVMVHESPRRHVVRSRVMGLEATFAFSFEATEGGTRVRCDCEVVPGNLLARLYAGKVARMIEQADDRRIEQLRDAMSKAR